MTTDEGRVPYIRSSLKDYRGHPCTSCSFLIERLQKRFTHRLFALKLPEEKLCKDGRRAAPPHKPVAVPKPHFGLCHGKCCLFLAFGLDDWSAKPYYHPSIGAYGGLQLLARLWAPRLRNLFFKPYKPPLIGGVGGVDNPKPVQGLKFGWEGGHCSSCADPQPLHGGGRTRTRSENPKP